MRARDAFDASAASRFHRSPRAKERQKLISPQSARMLAYAGMYSAYSSTDSRGMHVRSLYSRIYRHTIQYSFHYLANREIRPLLPASRNAFTSQISKMTFRNARVLPSPAMPMPAGDRHDVLDQQLVFAAAFRLLFLSYTSLAGTKNLA